MDSNFPEPDVPADFAWDSMKLMLDNEAPATPPQNSFNPKKGPDNNFPIFFTTAILCIVSVAVWWFSTKSNPHSIRTKEIEQHLNADKISEKNIAENTTANNNVINNKRDTYQLNADAKNNKGNPLKKPMSNNTVLANEVSADSSPKNNSASTKKENIEKTEKTLSLNSLPGNKNEINSAKLTHGNRLTHKYKSNQITNKSGEVNKNINEVIVTKQGTSTASTSKTKNRKNRLKMEGFSQRDKSIRTGSDIASRDKGRPYVNKNINSKNGKRFLKNKVSFFDVGEEQKTTQNVDLSKSDNANSNSPLSLESKQNTKGVNSKIKIAIRPSVPVNIPANIGIDSIKNDLTAVKNDKKSKQKNTKKSKTTASKNSKESLFTKSINYGLQWNLTVSTPKNSNYFTGTNGKSQPYIWLLPSIWISKKINKQQLLLSFNLLQQNLTGNKFLTSSSGPASATDTSIVINNSAVNKTFGMSFGLQYNYTISPVFSVGFGINYNLQQKVLLNKVAILAASGTLISDSSSILKGSSSREAGLNKSFFAAKLEFAYTKKRYDAGINISAPLTNLSSLTSVNIKPLTGQVFFRWKIKK